MYLGDWLARWAEISPERTALIDGVSGRAWTYREMNLRAASLASVLAEQLGVRPGDRVALIANNGPEVFEALFACAKLGAAFVPLNWRLAVPELVGIARDCAPRAMIFEGAWAGTAEAICAEARIHASIGFGKGADTVPAALDYEDAIQAAPPAPTHQVAPEDLAMILYTSGTTGLPKGVMISWRQMVFNALNTTLACDLNTHDRSLAFLPLFHTGGLNCLATPLFHRGGSVVVMPRFDAAESVRIMRQWDVSIIVAVPTMYQMLLDAGLDGAKLPSLHTLLCGGAPCPHSLIERYLDLGYNFRQGYGLTEVGPNCFSLSPADVSRKLGTVGLPIFHSEARVSLPDNAEAAPNEVGELWLRGPHVTLGYWGKPEATAAVLDPQGWFHTGDLVKRDADGYFHIAGRKKEMFISGGENVYPAEVENTLAAHPGVQEVTVVGVPDARWGEVGLAAIVRRHNVDIPMDDASLRQWTRERLAPYKVPKHWRLVEELPKNSSGKIVKPAVLEMLFPAEE